VSRDFVKMKDRRTRDVKGVFLEVEFIEQPDGGAA
jgi:hypothetical protein